MSEHQMKEQLPQKSNRKLQQVNGQNTPTTAEGAENDLIRLQRLVGNQAVSRMLIQAKMTVGAADDPYEREADAVASQVMAKRDTVQRSEGGEAEDEELQMKRIQRSEGAEAEDEELQMKRAESIQRAPGVGINDDEALEQEADEMGAQAMRKASNVDMSGSFDVEQDVESRISAKSGSGQQIPDANRGMFESSMGHDFSSVNIHSDAESDTLNRQLGARAFTTGSDIFFRQGEYNPASSGGQELLAHELTHVVQQGGAKVQKKTEDENT